MKKGKIIISVILIAIIAICVVFIGKYYLNLQKAQDVNQKLQAEANTTQVNKNAVTPSEQPSSESQADIEKSKYPDMPSVDFETMWKTNTDIYAWIQVPGTKIDYPVLQKQDATDQYDDYYLQHTVDKASGLPGAIYTEPVNSIDFTDFNTVLYGHNMKNKTMFGSLHDYEDDTFFQQNKYVYVVTPNKDLVYEIFAAITYDNRHIMRSYDFTNDIDKQSFLNSILQSKNMNDHFRSDLPVTTGNKILTLSTCVGGDHSKRYIVEAVLVDEFEK